MRLKICKKYNFLFNNVFSLYSYNRNNINIVIRIIRLKILYLLFYLYKKINLIRVYKSYKLYIKCINITKNVIKLNNFKESILKMYLTFFINNFFYIFNKSFLMLNNNIIKSYSLINNYNNYLYYTNIIFNNNSIIKESNYFLYLYKKYNYIIFIWLYIIKYFNFYKLNESSIKLRSKKWVVLRSPHTNKKSKETFRMKKIKKNLCYPSFLYTNDNFIIKDIMTESVLLKNHIKQYII